MSLFIMDEIVDQNVSQNDGAHARPVQDGRVRPSFHVTDNCWINDPCAPGYDLKTGIYHLFYQCKPETSRNETLMNLTVFSR